MIRTAAAGLTLLLASGPALAACPVAADLASGGILLTDERHGKAWTELLTAGEDSSVRLINKLGETTYTQTLHGGLIVVHVSTDTGAFARDERFDQDLSTLFPLAPGTTHRLTGRRYVTGNRVFEVPFEMTVEIGGRETAEIGDCRYAALAVSFDETSHKPDGEPARFESEGLYLTEIGIYLPTRFGLPQKITRNSSLIDRIGDWASDTRQD